ncbi:MAG: SulP family inorganic anion transporter [Puniceicoccaceae bacterium]|nr:MAG: SulP family inorganic anion transporter [Puniceicoccaceae bacterium]
MPDTSPRTTPGLKPHLRLLPRSPVGPGYWQSGFKADLRAGINLALFAFPQGMAYALIAGLPIAYGIVGAAVASIAAPWFGGSRFISPGPTNATSVLMLSAFLALGATEADRMLLAPLLLLMVGMLLIVASFLRIATVIQFISRSVVAGYITAAAILIMVNQVQNALGFRIPASTTLIEVSMRTFTHLGLTDPVTVGMSLLTVVTYLALRRWAPVLPTVAATLVVASGAAALGRVFGFEVAQLTPVGASALSAGLPRLDFEQINLLASAALAISFLCILESSSIGKSLAARSGTRLDTNQEIYALGIANTLSGIFSGMAASGSLTRSALGWSSGAVSSFSNFISGTLIVAMLLAVGPLIGFIPRPALAVVVIFVALSLINPAQIRIILKSTSSDAAVFLATFCAALLFPLDTAIYLGVALSIVLFVKKAAKPELIEFTFTEEGQLAALKKSEPRATPDISIVHVEGNLFFGAAELFQEQLRRVCEDPNLKIIILRLKNAHHLDSSAILALEELIAQMRLLRRDLIVSGARRDVVLLFRRTGLLDTVGIENFFPESPLNPTLSTRDALKRAQEILGRHDANIRIFSPPDPSRDLPADTGSTGGR